MVMYCGFGKSAYLCTHKTTMRGGAVVARWAHNPKVVGSSPAPATKENRSTKIVDLFFVCIYADGDGVAAGEL